LSFTNIVFVLQSEASQLRIGGAKLDLVSHRRNRTPPGMSHHAGGYLQHLATSNNPRDITNSAISVYADISDIQFMTRNAAHETAERFPASRREEDNAGELHVDDDLLEPPCPARTQEERRRTTSRHGPGTPTLATAEQ
ncbi:hypothetical protein PQX77_003031, partial [Marasmius sp. AFHP31]